MPKSNPNFRSGFVEVDKRKSKLYYEMAGRGSTVLVLIHAGFLDNRMWDRQFSLFSKKQIQTVRYDVRGFGKSDRPKEKFSDSEDLKTLLQQLGLKKVVLLGVSNGGRIALDFAVEHPEFLKGLILVNFNVQGYESEGPDENKLWEEDERLSSRQVELAKGNKFREAVDAEIKLWAHAVGSTARKKIFEIALDNSHQILNPPYKFQVSPDPPAFKRLREIRVPTLIIIGDKDVKGNQVMDMRVHAMIKGSKLITIKGADHLPNISKPTQFNKMVLNFLKEIRNGE